MPGTESGGLKAAAKNLAREPDFYKRIGKRGGEVKGVRKGFALNPDLASRVGRIGGLKSKRRPKKAL